MPLPAGFQIDPQTGERVPIAAVQGTVVSSVPANAIRIDPATGERMAAAAAVIPPPAPAPAGNSIQAAPPRSEFQRIRQMVANSAVGRSLESFSPKIADTLGLTPTETVNSPNYQSDREQLAAPQYLRPDDPDPSKPAGRFDAFARGVLTGAGKLTSAPALAAGAGIAATAGLAAPAAPFVAPALKIAGGVQGAYGVGSSLYGAGKSYLQGDTAGGDEQLGEAVPNAALMAPLAAETAMRVPELVRSTLAGDINAPLPDGSGHTPATRFARVKTLGVQPNAADATNSGILNAVRAGTEKTAAGAPVYARTHGANMSALDNAQAGIANDFSTVDPLTAGTGIQTKLQQPFLAADDAAAKAGVAAQNAADDFITSRSPLTGEQARLKQQANLQANQQQLETTGGQQEQAIRSLVGDQPASSLDPMRSTARTIQAQNAPADKLVPGLAQKQTGSILQSFANMGADGSKPTIGDLLDLRTRLLDAKGNNNELVSGLADRDIERMIGAVHQTIDQSMPTGASADWQNANAIWRDMKETYDTPSSPYYSAVRGNSPQALTQGIGGTSPAAIAEMKARGADLGIVQRGNAEKLLGSTKDGQYDLGGFGKRLYQMPEENRLSLFGNDDNEKLQKLASDFQAIEPTRKAATAPIEDLRNAAFTPNPDNLVNGIGARTGSQFDRIAPMIGPEGVGAMQRAEFTNLLGKDQNGNPNFRTFGRQLAIQPPDYHGSLFGASPGGTARMDDLATASNMLTARDNPSGTAASAQKLGEFKGYIGGTGLAAERLFAGHPGEAAMAAAAAPLYNASTYGLARVMNSPGFVNYLMTPKPFQPFLPSGVPIATAAAAAAARKKQPAK